MKIFKWNHEKNEELKKQRGISFDDVVFYIQQGNLLTTIKHPNPSQYHNQKLFIVNINNYAYAVPFVESDDEIFLKTIFPSRKYSKKFLEVKNNEI